MKFKNIFFLIAALCITSFVLCSCHKDDEEEEVYKNYMTGDLSSNAPQYAIKGTTITLKTEGIVYPQEIKYSWLVMEVCPDTIPFNPATITLPDSVCTIDAIMIATPADRENYYSTSKTVSICVIDTALNKSLTGLVYGDGIVDQRDGKFYHTVRIGNLEWFAQNLAWGQAGLSYKGSDAVDAIFGKYYTWEEATGGVTADGLGSGPQGLCPEGWGVPTNDDWADLANAVSNGEISAFKDEWKGIGEKLSCESMLNGEKMWPYSPDNVHTNICGFNAIPAGNFQKSISLFRNDGGEYGFWWSATEKNVNQAFYRYIYYDADSAPYAAADKKSFAASVRCVRLAQ